MAIQCNLTILPSQFYYFRFVTASRNDQKQVICTSRHNFFVGNPQALENEPPGIRTSHDQNPLIGVLGGQLPSPSIDCSGASKIFPAKFVDLDIKAFAVGSAVSTVYGRLTA